MHVNVNEYNTKHVTKNTEMMMTVDLIMKMLKSRKAMTVNTHTEV